MIMRAALELFANEGYYNTSISRIARHAGISKGLMYNYFEGKEDLVMSIMEEGMDHILQTFDPNEDGHLSDEEMEYFIREIFRKLEENIQYWKLYFALFTQPSVHGMVMKSIAPVIARSVSMLTDYFRRKGVEKPGLEALVFASMMDGITFNYTINPDLFPLEQMTRYVIQRYSHNYKNRVK